MLHVSCVCKLWPICTAHMYVIQNEYNYVCMQLVNCGTHVILQIIDGKKT